MTLNEEKMNAPITDNEYRTLKTLKRRFRENGEAEQAAFCDRILAGLERADER